ncbi:MAG: PAS domain-containing protein [Candidatus Aminicenantes bacterium]|nr:PAS domain-containing protein [Candidatus Aminicenantes bacterium]
MQKDQIKGIRLIIAGIAILFVFIVIVRIFFDESKHFSPLFINSTTLIISLWTIIILFSLTFLFILLRNIIKLYYRKSKEETGGRFKNRLVFFFIAFSIIPTLLIFFFATDLIERGIEKWFSTDIDSIMTKTEELEPSYYQRAKDELKHFSKIMATDIKEYKKYTYENRIFLDNSIKKRMKEYKLDVVNIYRDDKEILTKFNPIIPLQEYKDLPRDIVWRSLGGDDYFPIDYLKNGVLIRSGVRFRTPEGERILVITGKYYPDKYIKNLKSLSSMVMKYNQLKPLKTPVKTTYFLLFLFITILIIFSASWLGFYLARGITTPIEKLVAAASEITKGNLDVKIDYQAQDEFNTLIKEFNKMVTDLKENRNKLSRRTIELKQRRSLTENILNNITSGVIALDSEGAIIDINPEAERMISLKSKDVQKKQFYSVFSENQYRDIKSIIEKAYKTKFKVIEKELNFKIKGKILNLATKITQIRNPENKKFSGLLVVLTDLTALMKAKRLLVWREVAKRIAHEIKNPLTPIQISSQRILKSLELPDEKFRKVVEDSLNIILQELESIKSLANEFSQFARLPEVNFTQGDINQILENLVSVYSSIYNTIEFKADLDVEIPVLVKMDTEQIKRIFVNLIDNAIDVMDKKGVVEISSKYIKGSQFIKVEIADNGPGISDEDKDRLFIPYFSNKSGGTGLGLAIAHNIIEEHNGLISIVDNYPSGARFIIEIPA